MSELLDTKTTSFSEIFERFYRLIEKDDTFWELYNVSKDELMNIVRKRAKSYLIESAYVITELGDSDIDWMDYDETLECFNFELNNVEKQLLASFMFERHMERDIARLRVFEVNATPDDLQIFSPSTARTSFMNMYNSVKNENRLLLAAYSSKDRRNKRKTINYSAYNTTTHKTGGEY